MAMQNMKVSYEDGTETYVQIDEAEETGKAILKAFQDAAKSDDSLVKSVAKGDPQPANKGGGGG